jgi:hypothetical protein
MKLKMTILSLISACTLACGADQIQIGWGEVDITPPFTKKVPLDGQYYQRIATGVHTPIMFVAVAFKKGGDYFLTGSIDNVSVRDVWVEEVRTELKKRLPEVDPAKVSINCIHTHCAPMIGSMGLLPEASRRKANDNNLWDLKSYGEFVTPRVVDALIKAWKNLESGSIQRAKGVADIGHCRIAMYRDGTGEMYGDTKRADFAGMSDGEDPNVEMIFTYNSKGKRTGAIFNVACPAQVMEASYKVSGDIAGVLREKMRKAYGKDFHVIYQPAASGCQSPRDLVRGYADTTDGWHEDTCEMLAERLFVAQRDAKCYEKEKAPILNHTTFKVKAPRRKVTKEEVAAAEKELAELLSKKTQAELFADFLAYTRAKEAKGGPGPYDSKKLPFVSADVAKAVIARGKDQVTRPDLEFEVNVMRLGDVAFVTCPFELYLVYGQIIKARSLAKQTFVMELCNGDYGYIPSPAVVKSRSYGSGVNNGELGPDGGYIYCDAAVEAINRFFSKK